MSWERIDFYRLKTGKTLDQVSDAIGVGRSMLMMVKSGKRNLSAKAEFRLAEAEREAGIETPLKRLEDELVIRGEISTPLVELRQKDAKLAKLLDAAAPQIRAMSDSLGRFAARFDTVESKLDTVLTRLDALEKKPKK
jgi:transcriptional regulator with XRE-family HTH domain